MKQLHHVPAAARAAEAGNTAAPGGCVLRQRFAQLVQDDSGQDLIEYALVAALIGVGALGVLRGLKNALGTTFNSVGNSLTSSVS